MTSTSNSGHLIFICIYDLIYHVLFDVMWYDLIIIEGHNSRKFYLVCSYLISSLKVSWDLLEPPGASKGPGHLGLKGCFHNKTLIEISRESGPGHLGLKSCASTIRL